MLTEKQKVAALILQHSVELLKPLSQDMNGIHSKEQKNALSDISDAITKVVLMDTVELDDTELVELSEMKEAYDRIKQYTITYS